MFENSFYVCPHCNKGTCFVFHPIIKKAKHPITRDRLNVYEGEITATDLVDCYPVEELAVTQCQACGKFVYWENEEIRYPIPHGIEPVKEMPENAKKTFIEAQSIIYLSPRSTCTLMRVCLEMMSDYVAEIRKDEHYNAKWELWKKIDYLSVPNNIHRICDACRDVGNETAHAGNKYGLSDGDTLEMAKILSRLANSLVEIWIKPEKDATNILERLKAAKEEKR